MGIKNDILHLRLSTTRKIIGFLRYYLETYDKEVKQKFVALLRKEWEAFYVNCYKWNKLLNVLHGEQVNSFIQVLTPEVIKFIDEKVEDSEVKTNIKILLETWRRLSKILLNTYIENTKEYEYRMVKYSQLIK